MPTLLDPPEAALAAVRAQVDRLLAGPPMPRPALARRLFLGVHCGIADEGHADRPALDALLATIRTELADLAQPIDGFRDLDVPAESTATVLVAADGSPVRIPDGCPRERVDAGWRVWAPAVSAPMDGRWVYWSSALTGRPRFDVRLYCNPRPERALPAWLRLVRGLAAAGVPSQTKISARLGSRRRADGIVVYLVDLAAARIAADLLTGTRPADPRTPGAGFGCPVGAGLTVGDRLAVPDGDFDLSFGYWWAAAIAQAWTAADRPGPGERRAAVAAQLDLLSAAWARIRTEWDDARPAS